MHITDGHCPSNAVINESYYVLRNPGSYPTKVDKRLDEWVVPERIDFSRKFPSRTRSPDNIPTTNEESSRRFTRNQKRRYVENSAQDSTIEAFDGPLIFVGVLPQRINALTTIADQILMTENLNDSLDSTTQKLELEHQEFTRVKFIDHIQFGKHEIDTWYFSPYPEEYRRLNKLWICEYCLKYMKSAQVWMKHVSESCKQHRPPGRQIYRKGGLIVFELDGNEQKVIFPR
ncbi:unnamed protein product [Echinostoma caproni]|uniref:Histone acetyltransferase n=1 Tax=Echinostoma caproni TaxID=27848 RepID=A0A183B2Y0_9TREM|nr:unnamed protein product [Echinostoma caproni]